MKTLIKNAKVVTADSVLEDGVVAYENGIITAVGKAPVNVDNIIDAEGNYLIPGFVELHCHGGVGYGFMRANERQFEDIARFHLSHGVTTLYATTISAGADEIEKCLKLITEYKRKHENSIIEGVHLEGPYLNVNQCGAQDPQHIKKPNSGELAYLMEKYPIIKRVSAASELDENYAFVSEGLRRGAVMGIAHTDADFKEVVEAHENGYTVATHLYSGMNGTVRKNLYRVAGAVEAALYLDGMTVEVIADGKHLPTELLKYIYKIKGADKICLITDATAAAGLKNGSRTMLGDLKVIVDDDVAKLDDLSSFAGSTATGDRLYKTMMKAIGKDFVALSKMSSLTPARIMGLDDRGEIAVSKRADMLIINEHGDIIEVITDKVG